ncbi:unnamed protein product [Cuscuta campestris]|uniref:Uncharacterized protein n=1 Tax=Cuscuta campestris TaxID=132261 RepID=A0A484NCU7_9ASTE|nr:unnamed protein product [Cuscuta campestris]
MSKRCCWVNIAVQKLSANALYFWLKLDSAVGKATSLFQMFLETQPWLNSDVYFVEPLKVAIHPVNFAVKPVEGVGDGGKVGPGLEFGWANSQTTPWRGSGSGRSGVVRPLLEGLGADRPNLRGLREWANGGGNLELFKDVHHHERVREEVIVVGGRSNRHVDHDKLCPIDWGRVHDRMDEFEVLTGHDCVAMLPGLDDSGHVVEKKPAFGVCGVDGGVARGMADKLGYAKLSEDKALVVEHPVLSAILGDVVALVGEAGDAPKLLNGKLYRCALNKRVEHVALTLEVGVEDPNQRRVDLLPSPGEEWPKAGLMKLRVEVVVALKLREALRDDPWGSHNPFREEREKAGALLLGIEPEVRPIAVVEAFLGGCRRRPGFGL